MTEVFNANLFVCSRSGTLFAVFNDFVHQSSLVLRNRELRDSLLVGSLQPGFLFLWIVVGRRRVLDFAFRRRTSQSHIAFEIRVRNALHSGQRVDTKWVSVRTRCLLTFKNYFTHQTIARRFVLAKIDTRYFFKYFFCCIIGIRCRLNRFQLENIVDVWCSFAFGHFLSHF